MIQLTIYGTPIPQGSLRAFKHAKTGAVITTSDNVKTKPWKQQVSLMAISEMRGEMIEGPVTLRLSFFLPKPKSVKRAHPTVKPDIDKLARAVLDALTGIVYRDDAQVTSVLAQKFYGDVAKCEIYIENHAAPINELYAAWVPALNALPFREV